MKKLLAISLFALSIGAYGADNFNTLDAAPSIGTGSSVIGKVGIDQTTPGTTNAVQANAGTNLNTSALALDASVTATTGSKAAGTAAASAVLTGGVYNSTLPAPTTGQQTALQVDATGRLRVNASEVASGATDSGNPIKIGAVYNSTIPTFTTGQRGDMQIGSRGGLHIDLYTPDSNLPIAVSAAPADGASNSSVGYIFHTRGQALNPAGTWDKIRSGVIIPSATLTGHQNSLPWAIYNATPTVRTEGQGGPLQVDTNGALNVVNAASSTGGYAFSNLKANATTTIKSGVGRLHSLTINTKGITNTITVYDNTAGSGTTIATIDTTLSQETLTFDLAFTTGLTVVIAGGTAADITITYK